MTPESKERIKKGAARGGAALRGEAKSHAVKGMRTGRGSAGRSNSCGCEVRQRGGQPAWYEGEPLASEEGSYFADVARACERFLIGRGKLVGAGSFHFGSGRFEK